MALQNFSDGELPLIGASWLNKIDVFVTTLFADATTVAAALAALEGTAIGIAVFQAANQAAGRSAIDAAASNGSALNAFAAKSITFPAGTASIAPVNKTAGTNLTTPTAGAEEYDGKVFYQTPNASNRAVSDCRHFTCLTTDFAGSDVNTAQPFFSSSQDVITVPASTSYEFELSASLVRAAGSTSHTLGILFGGTATFTSIGYTALVTTTTGNVLGTPSMIFGLVATSVVVTGASTSTTENNCVKVKGIMRVNGAGTIIPQFIYSAAPGGAPTVRANSYFRLTPIGSNTVASVGNWS